MSHGLNPAQHQAVNTLRGPLLVLAGAGTGKTRVITYRIANLIRHGTTPSRILGVTFTNKAAREMRQRVLKLLGDRTDDPPMVTTFHSLGVNILRQEIDKLGYPKKFAIYDRGDQESVARGVLREMKIDPKSVRPADLLVAISRRKTQQSGAGLSFAGRGGNVELMPLFRKYQAALKEAGALDFDDLLACTEELFDKFPEVLKRQQARFDHILVDEYQDTNASQYRIITALARPHSNLCVVGDDDQSIYAWRGADIRNILDFATQFPDATVVRLEENYRCCPNILRLANQLIAHNAERQVKTLRAARPTHDEPRFSKFEDEVAEAGAVARDIAVTVTKEKRPYRDFAVLFRTNEQPRLFETELRARSIPYVLVGGFSFFDRREVRDVLAYLKVLANPADEVSLLRIINTPPRGLGSGMVEKLLARAVAAGKPMGAILDDVAAENALPARAIAGLRSLLGALADARRRLAARALVGAARDLVEQVDYRAEIVRNYSLPADQQARWESVGEVLSMLSRYEQGTSKPTLDGFLEQIALENQEQEQEQQEESRKRDAVTLMTLHSAKGLEFPCVYLVGLEEGLLPHERSSESESGIAEERRLAYVGITRARDRLTLTRALSRTRFGRKQVSEPSRFLPEMFGAAPAAKEKPPVTAVATARRKPAQRRAARGTAKRRSLR